MAATDHLKILQEQIKSTLAEQESVAVELVRDRVLSDKTLEQITAIKGCLMWIDHHIRNADFAEAKRENKRIS